MNALDTLEASATHVNNVPQPQGLKTVLLVDDGDESRIMTKWFLSSFGFAVETARDAEEALRVFNPKAHDLIITDNSMPGMTGLEMAHIIKLRSPSTPILMYTGNPPESRDCLDVVVQRPTHLLVLKDAVEKIFARGATSDNSRT